MNIMELGALGELVGGFAVIGSLIYLALQVRQNTSHVAHSAYSARMSALSNIDTSLTNVRLSIADNADLADLVVRGLENYRGLARPEQMRVHAVLEVLVDLIQEFFRRDQEGMIERKVL